MTHIYKNSKQGRPSATKMANKELDEFFFESNNHFSGHIPQSVEDRNPYAIVSAY